MGMTMVNGESGGQEHGQGQGRFLVGRNRNTQSQHGDGYAELDARQNAGIVQVIDDLESTDLLTAADLYIGDYSSNVIEFSNFDRPILFYDAQERFFDSKIYDLYAGASTPFHSADYIARLARLALGNLEINQAGRQRLCRHFNYNIGGATKAVVEAISGLS